MDRNSRYIIMIFCNINFNQKNKADLFTPAGSNNLKMIITVNAAFIDAANESKRFLDILNNNYVVFDGQVPYYTAKILSNLGLLPRHSIIKK